MSTDLAILNSSSLNSDFYRTKHYSGVFGVISEYEFDLQLWKLYTRPIIGKIMLLPFSYLKAKMHIRHHFLNLGFKEKLSKPQISGGIHIFKNYMLTIIKIKLNLN